MIYGCAMILIVRICCLPRMLYILRLIISIYHRYWQKSLSMWRNYVKQDMSSDIATAKKTAFLKKNKKKLYEPYTTPRVIWELLGFAVRIICFLTMRVHL